MQTTDKNGVIIQEGDMVQVHDRYENWLGIVKQIFRSEYGSFSVQPIGWQSTPHFLTPERITKVDEEKVNRELEIETQ